MSDNAGDSKWEDLERRVQALESKVGSLPEQKPIDPTVPPGLMDIEVPIPSAQAIVATARTTWALFEMFGELHNLFWTLFDRRYHQGWFTRLATIVLVGLILTSHWWAGDSFVSRVWDKLIDLVFALILFLVLSLETRRYKEWRSKR